MSWMMVEVEFDETVGLIHLGNLQFGDNSERKSNKRSCVLRCLARLFLGLRQDRSFQIVEAA